MVRFPEAACARWRVDPSQGIARTPTISIEPRQGRHPAWQLRGGRRRLLPPASPANADNLGGRSFPTAGPWATTRCHPRCGLKTHHFGVSASPFSQRTVGWRMPPALRADTPRALTAVGPREQDPPMAEELNCNQPSCGLLPRPPSPRRIRKDHAVVACIAPAVSSLFFSPLPAGEGRREKEFSEGKHVTRRSHVSVRRRSK